MYVQDVDIGIPSQVLVRNDVALQAPMVKENYLSSVDVLWWMRILKHGDLAIVNKALVNLNQGGHTTITSSITDVELDNELIRLRKKLRATIDKNRRPDEKTVMQALWFMRAASRLKGKKLVDALRLFSRVRRPRAWFLGVQWLLRRLFPGRFNAVPRRQISSVAFDQKRYGADTYLTRHFGQSPRPQIHLGGDGAPCAVGRREALLSLQPAPGFRLAPVYPALLWGRGGKGCPYL